jgi:hypothetical protein
MTAGCDVGGWQLLYRGPPISGPKPPAAVRTAPVARRSQPVFHAGRRARAPPTLRSPPLTGPAPAQDARPPASDARAAFPVSSASAGLSASAENADARTDVAEGTDARRRRSGGCAPEPLPYLPYVRPHPARFGNVVRRPGRRPPSVCRQRRPSRAPSRQGGAHPGGRSG